MRKHWRIDPHNKKEIDDAFIERCLALWDEGKDSKDISIATFQSEAVCQQAVRIGRERRKKGQSTRNGGDRIP